MAPSLAAPGAPRMSGTPGRGAPHAERRTPNAARHTCTHAHAARHTPHAARHRPWPPAGVSGG
ncbi:hypothetical protein E2651_43140 [Streptomyces sp. MZ04]|nr:hypothetical protein E2651_43140 [Streptomyces sp. MZ04]